MTETKYILKYAKDNHARWIDMEHSTEEDALNFFKEIKGMRPEVIGIIKKVTSETLHTFKSEQLDTIYNTT